MATNTYLSAALLKRLDQLGMSRRELARRAGLSRQTIHNIEHEGATSFRASTLDALDEALKWAPGTALALSLGKGKASVIENRVEQYLCKIAVHLSRMSSEELELTLIMMEEHELGHSNLPTEQFTRKVGKLVAKCLTDVSIVLGERTQKHAS